MIRLFILLQYCGLAAMVGGVVSLNFAIFSLGLIVFAGALIAENTYPKKPKIQGRK